MELRHEVDSLSDYADHFGVSVVVDYWKMSSDVLMYEGRIFARLWGRNLKAWTKIAYKYLDV
jgi:hypothetical protein